MLVFLTKISSLISFDGEIQNLTGTSGIALDDGGGLLPEPLPITPLSVLSWFRALLPGFSCGYSPAPTPAPLMRYAMQYNGF